MSWIYLLPFWNVFIDFDGTIFITFKFDWQRDDWSVSVVDLSSNLDLVFFNFSTMISLTFIDTCSFGHIFVLDACNALKS